MGSRPGPRYPFDVVSTRVYLSTLGRPVGPDEAVVSVFDRGFLYGDSVYETLRTAGGRPVELGRHLARLHRSAEGIALDLPFEDAEIVSAMEATLAAADNDDAKVRIVVTRGGGPMAIDTRKSESPLLVIYVQPIELPDEAAYERGLSAHIVGIQKNNRGMIDPGLKTGNYLPSILALRQAVAQRGEDAIMINADGHIAEGATSNVFMVAAGKVVTPDLETGVLAGITRELVIERCGEIDVACEERTITPEELRAADEVFLTSSVRGIMPVTTLDGATVGDGRMGVVTRRLHEAYGRYLDQVARGER